MTSLAWLANAEALALMGMLLNAGVFLWWLARGGLARRVDASPASPATRAAR